MLGGEQGTDSSTEFMARDGRVNQHVSVKGVHAVALAARSPSLYLSDESLRPVRTKCGMCRQWGPPAPCESLSNYPGNGQRFVGPASPQGIGPDEDGHGLAVAGNGHLLASSYAVKELPQGRSRFADTQAGRHQQQNCTLMYIIVQTKGYFPW
jgi:hypothetical protein